MGECRACRGLLMAFLAYFCIKIIDIKVARNLKLARSKRSHPRSPTFNKPHADIIQKRQGPDMDGKLRGSKDFQRTKRFYMGRYMKESKGNITSYHRIGSCVQLVGLEKNIEHNGKIGIVKGFYKSTLRYCILLIPDRIKYKVKPEYVISKDFKLHQSVRIRNLTKQIQYNDRAGKVAIVHTRNGTCRVRLVGSLEGKYVTVPMKNLEAGDYHERELMAKIHTQIPEIRSETSSEMLSDSASENEVVSRKFKESLSEDNSENEESCKSKHGKKQNTKMRRQLKKNPQKVASNSNLF